MILGEHRTAIVLAKLRWNLTGIRLAAGERYFITAAGIWVDWFIPHGPDGDPSKNFYMRAVEHLRRMKDNNWFELIGALDSSIDAAFPIGSSCEYSPQEGGELTCFANDIEEFYFNNYGKVSLTVRRIG